jgi:hypothetical protein
MKQSATICVIRGRKKNFPQISQIRADIKTRHDQETVPYSFINLAIVYQPANHFTIVLAGDNERNQTLDQVVVAGKYS